MAKEVEVGQSEAQGHLSSRPTWSTRYPVSERELTETKVAL